MHITDEQVQLTIKAFTESLMCINIHPENGDKISHEAKNIIKERIIFFEEIAKSGVENEPKK